mgnify:CR=1 FL=1
MTNNPDSPRLPLSWWEGAHSAPLSLFLGTMPFEDHVRVFGAAGDFASALAASRAHLDVGPGCCVLIGGSTAARRAVYDLLPPPAAPRGVEIYGPDNPPPVGQFDLVTCGSVIQHLNAPQAAELLELIARSMRPGGSAWLELVHFHSSAAQDVVHGEVSLATLEGGGRSWLPETIPLPTSLQIVGSGVHVEREGFDGFTGYVVELARV